MDEVDWSLYDITYDDTDYRAAAGPLILIRKLFTAFLVILSVGTLLILSLVFSLWIRGRNNEMGILMSVGTKKRMIFAQVLLECGIIAAAAFFVAALAYRPVASGVRHVTEEWLFAPAAEEEYGVEFDMEMDRFEIHREASGFHVLQQNAEWRDMAELFGVMFLAVMGAALHSAVKIVNQKPMEALIKK